MIVGIKELQTLLLSPKASFMPVYSLIRSNTPWETALCCVVAEAVALTTRTGHRRK
jgi:hypothetical protein